MHSVRRCCAHPAHRLGSFLRVARRQVASMASASDACAHSVPISNRGLEFLVDKTAVATPVLLVIKDTLEASLQQHSVSRWAAVCKFKGGSGELLLVPSADGGVSKVMLGLSSQDDMWAAAALAKLPAGTYEVVGDISEAQANKVALGFALGCYSFARYKKQDKAAESASPSCPESPGSDKPCLVWPSAANRQSVAALSAAFYLTRDLITTPAEDLGPQHLVAEVQALAALHPGATTRVLQGDELLQENYPAIHTVGRASSRPPALVDLRWSPAGQHAEDLPLLTLVGKGVCFDTGGLDIKTASGMKLMKKDMGGAAFVMALSHLVMAHNLPVRLRLMVPAVENSISGNAFRPLDVLQTRAGLTVENTNTDAEGRLILCDALFDAASESPDLLIDVATLTGAARAALGADIPAVFSNDNESWLQLQAASEQEDDPLWRLPLFKGYRKHLDSKVADLTSTGGDVGAGAIVAALYLQEFVQGAPRWLHVDTGGYNRTSSLGRPEGGEALGLRAMWAFISARYLKQ